MSDGYQITNQITPRLDPNAPAGPTSHTGGYNYQGTSKGSTGTSIINTGASSKNSNTFPLPNGTLVTIPYHGWYFNIPITAPSSEKIKAEKKDDRDGCDCVKCKEFYPFAEPNQDDGTLICFSCRNGY